jgi:integrase
VYLGPAGDPETEAAYHDAVAAYTESRQRVTLPDPTVAQLASAYLKDRAPTLCDGAGHRVSAIVSDLCGLYGGMHAGQFSPNCLRAVRQIWIDRGSVRNTVNAYTRIVVRAFKWGASHEMFPASVYQALACVDGLKQGEKGLTDNAPVGAVPDADVDAVLATVPRHVALAIRLQLLTGARPGEILGLRVGDIDDKGPIWKAPIKNHKTAKLGKSRCLYFGAKAQTVLVVETLAWQDDCYIVFVPGYPRRPYNVRSYSDIVKAHCKRAGITPWHPHQLRHSFATKASQEFPEDTVRAMLGHSAVAMTQRYAHAEQGKAESIAERIG